MLRVKTIDAHAAGEPLRLIVDGFPSPRGRTMLEKREWVLRHADHLRRALMLEPRGHADMYGAVLTGSTTADFDVFFLHNEGYSTMCGHAIIALTKFVVEAGLVQGERVAFNVPAGRIESRARIEEGRVVDSAFRNVPSFLYRRDQAIDTEVGEVKFDIAYGGAFYAIVEAEPLGLSLDESAYAQLISTGRAIKHAIMQAMPIEHPFEPDLSFLYGTIFTGPAREAVHHSRNVCIFADGEVDRSPTGSGVSARAALHYAKGEVRLNEPITIESILGSTMTVRAVEQTKFGAYDAVIPEVSGTAHFTGRNEFWFDPKDPLRTGFILR